MKIISDFRLNLLALEKDDASCASPWRRRERRLRGIARVVHFSVRAAAFAFLVNVGREIAGLPQLADRFVGRIGFNEPVDS